MKKLPKVLMFLILGVFVGVGSAMAVPFNDGGVSQSVSPVPEPATMLLFGFGLIGLAVLGRKKFKRRS